MVSKVFRFILILSLSVILFECSFDTKTGIWIDKPKQKAKDFYSQILTSQKTNENIFYQAQQRILRNYGE